MDGIASGELNGPVAVRARARAAGQPDWLESTLKITAGRDPLGFQTITTDRILPRLVPGVLVLSRRARYFSFYSFLLAEYQNRELPASNNGLSDFIKHREYELALAVQLCPNGCANQAAASNGAERAGPAVNRGLTSFPRDESVVSYLGGYGLYYRSPMIDLGLVAPRGTPFAQSEGTSKVDVLWPNVERGRELAAAFDAATRDTEYRKRYFTGEHEIPRDVLIEYSTRACLCRLGEHPEERAVLRDALLNGSELEPPGDVDRRREAFAFLLWLADRDERVIRSDAAFRREIWEAYEQHAAGGERLAATGARWAALIAKEFTQDAAAILWEVVCRTGLAAGMADGVPAADFGRVIVDPLVPTIELELAGHSITVEPSTSTGSLATAVLSASEREPLEHLRAWAIADGRAIAALAFLLAVRGRIGFLRDASAAWAEIAGQSGEHQPGLGRLMVRLDGHLVSEPTVRATMDWLVRTIVVWPHEAIAYSKLPEHTFRFRWESGRLRFYDLRPERFGLTNIRRDALSRLSADIGLVDWTPSGGTPTAIGNALVAEVFG